MTMIRKIAQFIATTIAAIAVALSTRADPSPPRAPHETGAGEVVASFMPVLAGIGIGVWDLYATFVG